MKKIFGIMGMCFLSLSLVIGLSACGTNDSQKDADNSEENKTLIVGTEAGFAPFEYIGEENGDIVGVDIDIADAIAKKLKKDLIIKNMAFDAALVAVSTGKVDLAIAGVSITEERQKNMDFSIPYLESYQVIVVNAEHPGVTIPTAEGLKDKIIGIQKGTIAADWLKENVDAQEIKEYDQYALAAMDLVQEKICAILVDNIVAEDMIANSENKLKILVGEPIMLEKIAIALEKGNTELKKQVDEVIRELKDSGKIKEFLNKHSNSGE